MRIWALLAHSREDEVTADQTGEDQHKQKKEARRAYRFGALACLFPVLSLLLQLELEQLCELLSVG